jgi:hypothetical protein
MDAKRERAQMQRMLRRARRLDAMLGYRRSVACVEA